MRAFYRERAARAGAPVCHTGAVTFIQRFGSAANLNLHFHMLAIDGAFTEHEDGALDFHPARPLTNADVARLVAVVRARVELWLERKGLLDGDALDVLADEAPLLAHAYATSITGKSALERPFAPVHRVGHAERARPRALRALQAHDEGFDLDASVRIAAQHAANRDALERILRYCARPPIADDRLQLRPDGRVSLTLKTPWHDGTTHLDLDPLDFLARCAALIPRPHKNLLVYHGVLAAHASLRERVIAYGRSPASAPAASVRTAHANPTSPHDTTRCPEDTSSPPTASHAAPSHRRSSWADLMRHAFGFDLLSCPRCGAKMLLLATILDRVTIRRILAHLRLPMDAEPTAPARASPTGDLWPDHAA